MTRKDDKHSLTKQNKYSLPKIKVLILMLINDEDGLEICKYIYVYILIRIEWIFICIILSFLEPVKTVQNV